MFKLKWAIKHARVVIFLIAFGGNLFSQSNEEFRATWVVDFHWLSPDKSAEDNEAAIRKILDNHKAANMSSVLWQVRRFGSVYYPSAIEPWGTEVNFVNPGFDPLQYALEQAHERGLELHAWFNTFESRHQLQGSPSQVHPEWICRDQDGNVMPPELAWLSPGIADVREYLISVAMEVVRNYDIDGLHMDFVRWNEHTNSTNTIKSGDLNSQNFLPDGMISEKQLSELQTNASGRYLYDTEHPFSAGVPTGFSSWEDWWRASVTALVSTLHDSIQSVKPWVRLSPAALGRYNWGGWQGFNVVYQDAALWFNEGYIDQLVGMHYHWDQATQIKDVLSTGCPSCWQQFIEPGIAAGRLYSVGLWSDNFAVKKIFGRHTSIVDGVRTIPWVDGFQFFSYGSWRDNTYWETSKNKFFQKLTKIKSNGLFDDVAPSAPSLTVAKLDSLNYQVGIPPAPPGEDNWYLIYRSEDASLDVDDDEIISRHFGGGGFTYTDAISGNQDFNDSYTYFATALDRFWNESDTSPSFLSDAIPSLPPTVVSSEPVQNDTLAVNGEIVLEFSKTIDMASANAAFSLVPGAGTAQISWSDDRKIVTISFGQLLAFATDYSLTVSEQLQDINGRALDGNADGVEGDTYVLNFTTLSEDISGPRLIASFPVANGSETDFTLDEVITFAFDELVDPASISVDAITLSGPNGPIVTGHHLAQVGIKSVLGIQSIEPLEQEQDYTISLSPDIADTSGNPIGSEINFGFRSATERYSDVVIIDRFLSVTSWFQPNGSGSTSGIVVPNTTFGMTTGAYLPSVSSRQRISPTLNYEWDENANHWLIRIFLSGGAPRAVEFDSTYTLQVHVFGDGSGNRFRFAIDDKLPVESGANHEVSAWTTIDWVGWRLVEWKLSDLSQGGTWIGDGIPHGLLRFDSFQLSHDPGDAAIGRIYFDNLRLVKKTNLLVSVASTETQVPDRFQLFQNYPNPFNPSTTISFSVPNVGFVTLKIYDVLGRKVQTLVEERKQAGIYRVSFDASNLPSGIYVYQLGLQGKTISRRMTFVK